MIRSVPGKIKAQCRRIFCLQHPLSAGNCDKKYFQTSWNQVGIGIGLMSLWIRLCCISACTHQLDSKRNFCHIRNVLWWNCKCQCWNIRSVVPLLYMSHFFFKNLQGIRTGWMNSILHWLHNQEDIKCFLLNYSVVCLAFDCIIFLRRMTFCIDCPDNWLRFK